MGLTVRLDYRSRAVRVPTDLNPSRSVQAVRLSCTGDMMNSDHAGMLGSVWIRPTGTALHAIEHAVRLAHQSAGGPPVQPHVSLMGGIELTPDTASTFQRLASRITGFEIRLGKIEWRDEYYRSLFIRVEPSDKLIA